jgi:molybdopterin converting factor subunit 1
VSVRVLYFAACREPAGTSSEELDVGGRTVDDVVRALVEKHPGLAKIAPRCRVAVNQSFARGDDVVPDGAELALVPPVAGG